MALNWSATYSVVSARIAVVIAYGNPTPRGPNLGGKELRVGIAQPSFSLQIQGCQPSGADAVRGFREATTPAAAAILERLSDLPLTPPPFFDVSPFAKYRRRLAFGNTNDLCEILAKPMAQ
jgi:hypothetical protein